jgi:hypothetical protein
MVQACSALEVQFRFRHPILHTKARHSSTDLAREAYQDAVAFFDKELTSDETKRRWLKGYQSINEIQEVVNDARAKYNSSSKNKKLQLWLERLSESLMYYGAVLDTLAQHHPEYVSLAWGTVKFVFVVRPQLSATYCTMEAYMWSIKGILNHGELVLEFSRALAQIGEVLPRQEFTAALYPTPRMRDALTMLYAHVMKFLLRAVKWYQMGPAGRAFTAIRKPFDLDLKDIVEQVRLCSERIEKIASTASKAELRDVHLKVSGMQDNSRNTDVKISDMQGHMGDMRAAIVDVQSKVGTLGMQMSQLFQVALSEVPISGLVSCTY